ncbi:MAG TPA: LytR C-terminal domain-containing protein [Ignavibacteriaceae bacterium]|nr:LytR C-terminal domain-containing protein [Ignavibacteriaceae bacterium]
MPESNFSDSSNSSDSVLSKNKNLFFIIVSVILFVFTVFLSYSLLDKLGIINSNSKKEVQPKNVQQLIQVEVLNGCGVGGVGDKVTDVIRSKGIDVVKTGNYMTFDIDQTFIIDRVGKIETAYKVADSLGIDKKNIITQTNKQYFLDLTIVIGKDFNKYFQKSRS